MAIQYMVTHECDEGRICSTQDEHTIFKTFGEANDLLNDLRNSPQCDYTLKVVTIEDVHYKLRDHDKKIGRYLWIKAHGSDQLRKAYDLGYKCEERYLLERARYEGLVGYDIDWCGTMKTKPCPCPSVEAIAEIESKLNRPDAYRHYLKAEYVVYVRNIRRRDERYSVNPHKEACVVSFMGYKFFKYIQHDLDVWKNLIGTTVRCRFGRGNRHARPDDAIRNVDVLSVRENEVEIQIEGDSFNSGWYTIHGGYIGRYGHEDGKHLSKIGDD
jgi:hypothetical protein